MSKDKAKELGLKPMATFRFHTAEGCPPEYMGVGPSVAVPKVLKIAGMTLDQCLTILAEMTENVKLRSLVGTIQKAVHSGSSFTDALAKHPDVFSKLYVNMIKAGEAGGVLEAVLDRLSSFMEESQKLK